MDTNTYCSTEITELAKAMLKVQAALQPAMKDRENPFTKSNYATLNSVMESCRDALLENGIWITQFPVPVETGHVGLVTKLTHVESGQWQSSLMVMPLPKTDPQGYGSAMTYSRRYALSALIGIVTEEDDDGAAAGIESGQRPKRKSPVRQREDGPAMEKKPAADPPIQQDEPIIAAMPKLDGITYQTIAATDGRRCIVATGNTQPKKEILLGIGFKWNPQRKIWWKYADAA